MLEAFNETLRGAKKVGNLMADAWYAALRKERVILPEIDLLRDNLLETATFFPTPKDGVAALAYIREAKQPRNVFFSTTYEDHHGGLTARQLTPEEEFNMESEPKDFTPASPEKINRVVAKMNEMGRKLRMERWEVN